MSRLSSTPIYPPIGEKRLHISEFLPENPVMNRESLDEEKERKTLLERELSEKIELSLIPS